MKRDTMYMKGPIHFSLNRRFATLKKKALVNRKEFGSYGTGLYATISDVFIDKP